MQFLGQVRVPGDDNDPAPLLLLFVCQNAPGLCGEWDAKDGGNKVVAVSTTDLALVAPPPDGETSRPTRYGAKVIAQPETSYEAAAGAWARQGGGKGTSVLGQLGGSPAWIQDEEVPACDCCGKPMGFVAQLEEGPDPRTAMNFGGRGCAYIFRCNCDAASAAMLWQC